MRGLLASLALLLIASAAGAFLIANSASNGGFRYDRLPEGRIPASVLVDTEAIPGINDPLEVTQQLMDQWNSIPGARPIFGLAKSGGPFNGSTVKETFGIFSNSIHEIAWDDTGEIFNEFGLSSSVLGITLKSVDGSGNLLDFLVVINTARQALSAPGTGASAEQLLRGTLVHELGHAVGLAHSPVGMSNSTSFGIAVLQASEMPSMHPFRLPLRPQEGATLERDDEAALIENYGDDTSGLGSISGRVRALSGAPADQIAVRVIGPAGSDSAHIGILTDADGTNQGTYTVPHLLPGRYRVLIETINGRASVTGQTLALGEDDLGANPFLHARDEYYAPGDSYDPAVDSPTQFTEISVRAGRDTGFIDFVLNAAPLERDRASNGRLTSADARLPALGGSFRLADFHVFSGEAGQEAEISVQTSSFTPQIRLLRPDDLSVEAEETPNAGGTTVLRQTLEQSGIYTVVVFPRQTVSTGQGPYVLLVRGAGAALPEPVPPSGASVRRGAASPGDQRFGSPICSLPVLQLEFEAPSHEELWVDRIEVAISGTADDALDLTSVEVVHDRNRDGVRNAGEPVLASIEVGKNDPTLRFDGLELELDPGSVGALLVVLDAEIVSVSTVARAGLPLLLALPVLLAGIVLRRRRRVAIVCLALSLVLVPVGCGGGSSSGCNQPFSTETQSVTFRATVDASGIVAFAPSSDPAQPLDLGSAELSSGLLTVSN